MNDDRAEGYGEFPEDFLRKKKKSTGQKAALGCVVVAAAFVGLGLAGAIISVTSGESGEQASSTNTPAATTKSRTTADDSREAFMRQYRQLLAVASPCDKALAGLKAATDRFGRDGDTIQMMAATAAGQNQCGEAVKTIKAMSPPVGLPSKAVSKLNTAYTSCLRGYDRREQAFATATSALAGERADLNDAVDDIKRSQSDVVSCVVGFVAAANESGIDPKSLR